MERNDRIFHAIVILLLGMFIGVVLSITAYYGLFSNEEKEPERENIRITERESAWVSNVKAW